MKTHIITIGTEILIGQIIDTNSTWLATELTKLGISVEKIITIRDSKEAILKAIDHSYENADLVILTGGLGPTNDDITKTTLAEYFKSDIIFSEDIYKDVVRFLEQRGAKMNELNRQQATIPEKAIILPNKQGTAPGMLFKKHGKVCISLPGVPFEMKAIMNQYGFDAIKENFDLPFNYYHTTLITGIGESQLAERIADWETNLPKQMELAYLPSPGIIRLRLGLTGKDRIITKNLVLEQITKLETLIPDLIFGNSDVKIEEIVSDLLIKNKKTVSAAESCSGGSIAQSFTALAGCSTWFNGSVVAYANQAKSSLLKIPINIIKLHGAVSKEVVTLMAKNAKLQLKTDYSIATSGIAGPSGGTKDKPVGTIWIAVSGPNGEKAEKYTFGKERNINIMRTKIAALNLLRIQILEDNSN